METAAPSRARRFLHNVWTDGTFPAVLCLLVLSAVSLRRTLFSTKNVLSARHLDLALQFIHWRKFGFDELRAGHLALWNPHIFCGTPFLGGFQSALLYPPNWLYLCLPLCVAVNTGIALHVFLAGFGMYLWARHRGLHPVAGLFAGVLLMFSGPYFIHIFAGHLPNLCTMVWAPFVFLAIDGWFRHRTVGWLLLGAASVGMQLLAGHPQYVFYTGVAAALYCAVQIPVASRRVLATGGLAAIAAGGVALSAIQLFEGMHAAGESVRNHGTSEPFAAVFSFPPENLLTFLAPNFFGNLTKHDYWGRWDLWEMNGFFGITGLVMAVNGLAKGPRFQVWSCAAVASGLLVLALGAYTPLFHWLYLFAPGFGHFRGWSKFLFPAVMLLIMVAATGFDVLLRRGIPSWHLSLIAAGVGAAVLLTSLGADWSAGATNRSSPEPWHAWMQAIANTGSQYSSSGQIGTADYAREAGHYAARQLRFAAATFFVLAAVFVTARRYPVAITGVLVLAIAEMLIFARSTAASFPLRAAFATPDAEFLAVHTKGVSRVANEINHNLAMSLGTYDLWGYDPGVSRRYAEWMAVAQGLEPDDASDSMTVKQYPPLVASLLRCRYIIPSAYGDIDPPGDGEPAVIEERVTMPPTPQLLLVSKVKILTGNESIFDAIFAEGFDPQQLVVLESPPDPAPSATTPSGDVRLLGETSDALTIEANLPAPAILLVTDTYSDGWKARSLLPPGPGGTLQSHYQVMPADHFLRAIPLAAGHHKILLEYRPTAFVIGKWVTVVSLDLFLACLIAWAARRLHPKPALILPG